MSTSFEPLVENGLSQPGKELPLPGHSASDRFAAAHGGWAKKPRHKARESAMQQELAAAVETAREQGFRQGEAQAVRRRAGHGARHAGGLVGPERIRAAACRLFPPGGERGRPPGAGHRAQGAASRSPDRSAAAGGSGAGGAGPDAGGHPRGLADLAGVRRRRGASSATQHCRGAQTVEVVGDNSLTGPLACCKPRWAAPRSAWRAVARDRERLLRSAARAAGRYPMSNQALVPYFSQLESRPAVALARPGDPSRRQSPGVGRTAVLSGRVLRGTRFAADMSMPAR